MPLRLERPTLSAVFFALSLTPIANAQFSYGELVGFKSVKEELGVDAEALHAFDGLAYAHCNS